MTSKYVKAKEVVGPEVDEYIKHKLEQFHSYLLKDPSTHARHRKMDRIRHDIITRIAENIDDKNQYLEI